MRRLSRREFLVGTACAGTCAAGLVLGAAGYRATHDESQSNARVYRVGFVTGPPREPFRAALQQLGYVEGRNLLYEHREGLDAETSRAGAAELVAERVDVLVATGQLQVSGAVQATSEVPIVSMGLGGDLLAARLI